MTRPASITRIRSAFWTVLRRLGDDEGGAVGHQRVQRGADLLLSLSVSRWEVASSRIRIGASFRKARAMATRCRWPPDSLHAAPRRRGRGQPVRQAVHEVAQGGLVQGTAYVRVRHAAPGQADVRPQRVVEQVGVLRDQGDVLAQIVQAQLAQIGAAQG